VKTLNIAVTSAFLVLVLAMMSCSNRSDPERHTDNADRPGSGILQVAREVIDAFKAKDGKKLALWVHPEKGLRFSPSAFVNAASDLVFLKVQIETFWTDKKIYTWGYADATGEPINMTPSQYSREYIMNRNFSSPSSISVNSDKATGNTSNNAALVYPNAIRVEYYIAPSLRANIPGLDWAALRLVFEKNGDSWFLVGVIHDEWTP
jgi:hypothetical protein